MYKKEYLELKELIDIECNRSVIKPEYKEPIIFVHRNLKKMLKLYFKQSLNKMEKNK